MSNRPERSDPFTAPEIFVKIHPVVFIEGHAFVLEEGFLLCIPAVFRQADPSLGIDDPVPGETVPAAHAVEDSRHLPGAVGVPGHESDPPVGGDPAGGDAAEDVDHRPCKVFHEASL